MITRYLHWLWRERSYRWEEREFPELSDALVMRGRQVTKWLSERIEIT